jgi:hypothetical protein
LSNTKSHAPNRICDLQQIGHEIATPNRSCNQPLTSADQGGDAAPFVCHIFCPLQFFRSQQAVAADTFTNRLQRAAEEKCELNQYTWFWQRTIFEVEEGRADECGSRMDA